MDEEPSVRVVSGRREYPDLIEKISPDMSTQTKSVRDSAIDEGRLSGFCGMMAAVFTAF